MNNSFAGYLVVGAVLTLLQALAFAPWALALSWQSVRYTLFQPRTIGTVLAILAGISVGLAYLLSDNKDEKTLLFYGRVYGSILTANLALDLIVGVIGLLLWRWPKGGAVAQATVRESFRQPMFWLLTLVAVCVLVISMFVPYFTFGDDYKMYKLIGLDAALLATVVFAVLGAAMSIHDEIEGRTAITLMSKPITRRQFLLGKYAGMLIAAAAMTFAIGWLFNWTLYTKPYFDRLDEPSDPIAEQARQLLEGPINRSNLPSEYKPFLLGVAAWLGDTMGNLLGLGLGFGQVMVLLAIACALATRMAMVANLSLVLVVFFLGNLAPVLVQATAGLQGVNNPLSLVGFLPQLFEVLLPALSLFSNSAVIVRENPLELAEFAWYVGSVLVYAVGYTTIALLFGLILFEDRDLG